MTAETARQSAETLTFGAEVEQLLDLVANSLYSHKEIFVRELVSNASDALEKLRYEALSDNAILESDSDLKIGVTFNKDAKTITIRDNGIGMSREEAIDNLGTIARSGTRALKETLNAKKEADAAGSDQLIGQFGVGFYASFIVADQVVVRSRRAGMKPDQAIQWESNGKGQYTIKHIKKEARGTEIVLHLKEDETEFLDGYRLRTVIKKYSEHMPFPIVMDKIETEEDIQKKKENEIVVPEEEVVNSAAALWTKPASEIKREDYEKLYEQMFGYEGVLDVAHNRVEGKQEYTSLLYIPKRAPFDLWNRDVQRGLKLYVKRVFIMDDAEQLMPLYLRFIRGIVDSKDLALNISRELLQNNRVIERIRSGCVKRVLSMLEKMANNKPEDYQVFWKEYGQLLKEGPAEDFGNRDRVAKLLRFSTTHEDKEEQSVSFEDYISRMKEKQTKIYYIVADSYLAAKNSPLLEVFQKKGIEVLLLSDRVDEWLVSHLNEFDGKPLQSISRGSLDLDEIEENPESKEKKAKDEKTFSDVIKNIQSALSDQVKEVRLTHRLTSSPSCVVFDDSDLTGHMQRMMEAAGQAVPVSKPILELNPEHPLLAKVQSESDKDRVGRWSQVLLGQALLLEGESLKNPGVFIKEMNLLLETAA